jgi:hypothetical protein
MRITVTPNVISSSGEGLTKCTRYRVADFRFEKDFTVLIKAHITNIIVTLFPNNFYSICSPFYDSSKHKNALGCPNSKSSAFISFRISFWRRYTRLMSNDT